MDQDVVPRLVFGWPTHRNLIVPFVCELKVWIDVDDHTTISKTPVVNDLSYGKLGLHIEHVMIPIFLFFLHTGQIPFSE
jgi:hypothetical protein